MAHRIEGFTLIELLAALALAAMLVGFAVPALTGLLQSNRIAHAANTLVGHLNLGRLHAVTHRELVLICPSADGLSCSDSNRWESGWIVFRDPDRNGRIDAPSDLLRFGNSIEGLVIDSAGRTRVRYQPDGTAGGTNLTLKLCDPLDPAIGRAVIVSNTGRPRVDDVPNHLTCPAAP